MGLKRVNFEISDVVADKPAVDDNKEALPGGWRVHDSSAFVRDYGRYLITILLGSTDIDVCGRPARYHVITVVEDKTDGSIKDDVHQFFLNMEDASTYVIKRLLMYNKIFKKD